MTAADEIDAKKGKLLSLAFQRIILDEAHQIRLGGIFYARKVFLNHKIYFERINAYFQLTIKMLFILFSHILVQICDAS